MELRGIGRAALLMAAVVWAGCGDNVDMLTDARDGQTYKTTVIGGKKWMAQNLNYQTDSSWCYNNADSNCLKYGRLYAWNAAMKACPAGYHLPSWYEWDTLVETVGGRNVAGKELKAKRGWLWNDEDNVSGNGTDYYGFCALPGGHLFYNGKFYYGDEAGQWWTATESVRNSDRAHTWYTIYYIDEMLDNYDYGKREGFSVRCVADAK